MAVRIDQSRQERLLAKIDNLFARTSFRDFRKISNIDNSIARNATAPFSIGAPSIVTTTFARMIIRLCRL